MLNRKVATAAVIGGTMLAAGTLGWVAFGASLDAAGSPAPGTPLIQVRSTSNHTAFTSNEDPAHEAAETPEQEQAEHSGQGRGHCHHGHNGADGGSSDTTPSDPGVAPQSF